MIALVVLLVALACLVVGLVLTSSAWLIASLVTSGVAGLVLWRDRAMRGHATGGGALRGGAVPRPPERPASLVTGTAASDTADDDTADSGTGADEVWVVDGRPRYHRATCLILKGQHAEPIPRAQADEDGFIPCTMCEPDLPAARRER